MAFDSISAFLAMEGHGPYVWTCYAVFVVMVVGTTYWSAKRYRATYLMCKRSYEQQGPEGPATPKAAATFTRVEISQD
ncbi:heme exporter protein CcmD [Marinobacter sp.]|uniref:heme exporter protein CcmD n=1 Tax=Marinobacter sp. TaxID=50741 RepID=UPI002B269FD0|nr:heme exporter protein CcmD [Marinobacter sp.]